MKGNKKNDTSLCERWRKCLKCSAEYRVDPKKPHECYHATCSNCGEFTHVNHRCFIQPVTPKEDTPVEEDLEKPVEDNNDDDDDNEEKKGPPPPPLINFADIECYLTEERDFVPNLICWSTEEDDDICHAYTIEEFLNALEDLTEVEGDERPRKVITFFHNMRGFDGNFILEALYDQGRTVQRPLTKVPKFCILSQEISFLRTQ